MDGNLGTSAPAGRASPGGFQEISGGAGGGVVPSGGSGGDGGEAASMMVDSTSTEWTDEKHSLYLHSIEESFVNQLYNNGFSSSNSFCWASITQKDPSSRAEDLYSAQFKVLRGGCWGELKFERPCARADIQNETRILTNNPWIQRFRSASGDKRVDPLPSQHLRTDGIIGCTSRTGRQGHGMADGGEETSLNQQAPCYTRLCHQYSVGCNTEVSDQNFVDDLESVKQSRVCKKKRTRTTFTDARDQVVPYRNTMAISSSEGNVSSLEGKDVECTSTKAAKFG